MVLELCWDPHGLWCSLPESIFSTMIVALKRVRWTTPVHARGQDNQWCWEGPHTAAVLRCVCGGFVMCVLSSALAPVLLLKNLPSVLSVLNCHDTVTKHKPQTSSVSWPVQHNPLLQLWKDDRIGSLGLLRGCSGSAIPGKSLLEEQSQESDDVLWNSKSYVKYCGIYPALPHYLPFFSPFLSLFPSLPSSLSSFFLPSVLPFFPSSFPSSLSFFSPLFGCYQSSQDLFSFTIVHSHALFLNIGMRSSTHFYPGVP